MPSCYYEKARERETDYFLGEYFGQELSVDSHFHNNVELVYVLDGCVNACIEGKDYLVAKNNLIIAFSNERHSFSVDGYCHCYNLIIPQFTISSFSQYSKNVTYVSRLIYPCQHMPELEQCFQKLSTRNHPLLCKGYIYTILGHVLNLLPRFLNSTTVKRLDLSTQAVDYISKNYLSDFSLADLAKALNCNASTLSNMFSQKLHCNFREYLNSFRLNHALNLFAQGEDSILSVAVSSGFNSVRTFNRVFKSRYNLSPTEYLKKSNDIAVHPDTHFE